MSKAYNEVARAVADATIKRWLFDNQANIELDAEEPERIDDCSGAWRTAFMFMGRNHWASPNGRFPANASVSVVVQQTLGQAGIGDEGKVSFNVAWYYWEG